jgi:hypothetical protein
MIALSKRNPTKRLPPYGNQIVNDLSDLLILTGSDPWEMAQSETWFFRHKLIFPYNGDPAHFAWPVQRKVCVLYSFGDQEPYQTLKELSVELLHQGGIVRHLGSGNARRAARSDIPEGRMIDKNIEATLRAYRDKAIHAGMKGHTRTPSDFASLKAGLVLLTDFARHCWAIN